MLQDFRFALRQLRRTPVFASVTILTLALGIGANTAVFSVMNAVVLRWLPVAHPEQLVFLHTNGQPSKSSQTGHDDTSLTLPIYEQLRTESRIFSDLGFRASGLLVFGVTPPQTVRGDAAIVRFYQALVSRLRTLPGVEAVTLMSNRIGSGWSNNAGAVVDGHEPDPQASSPMRWNTVGPDYFHVLGIPLMLGRDFTDADGPSAPPVAVVNETFVQRYLPNREPLGHTVSLVKPYTIVGVAANSRYTGVREADRPMAYFPATQVPSIGGLHVEMRTMGDPAALLPQARRVVQEFGPDIPLLQPMTQTDQFLESFADERLFARLATFFGVLAVVLVATGLYGTLAYRVSRRTSEIGVRMALGAERRQVVWMVIRESLILSVIGIGAGLPLAIAGARMLKAMLFGISASDPISFAAALGGIAVVAIGASLIPARRAASVNPIVALRYE